MKKLTAFILTIILTLSALFCVSAKEKKYDFVDNQIIIVLSDEATKQVLDGKTGINPGYFSSYDIGVIDVKRLNNYQQAPQNLIYLLTINKNDCENVLKIVEILKTDKNFMLVEPNYYTHVIDATKASNPMKVSVKTKTVNYCKVKKAKQTVAPITVQKAKGKVTYKKVSGSKYLKLKSNGKVVVKKGAKKKTYTMKVKVTAKGDTKHKSLESIVKVKVKVK